MAGDARHGGGRPARHRRWRARLVAAAAAGVMLATALPGTAKTFTPAFSWGHAQHPTSGNATWQYLWNTGTGRMEGFVDVSNWANGSVILHMGQNYPINSGPTLSSFTAPVRINGYVQGRTGCSSGGVGRLFIGHFLWIWRADQGDWFDTSKDFWWEGGCYGGGGTIISGNHSRTRNLAFTAGRVFRPAIWYGVNAQSNGGRGWSDFCNSAHSRCRQTSNDPGERLMLTSIHTPNQAPRSRFYPVTVTYSQNLVSGTRIAGVSCDYDDRIVQTTVAVTGLKLLGASPQSISGNSPCLARDYLVRFAAPGTYAGSTTGRDQQGAVGSATGQARVLLFTSASSAAPAGVDVDVHTERLARIEHTALLDTAGNTVATRLAASALPVGPLAPLWSDLPVRPEAGLRTATVRLDEISRTARVLLDGRLVWEGRFVRTGSEWWQVEPAGSETGAWERADPVEPPSSEEIAQMRGETPVAPAGGPLIVRDWSPEEIVLSSPGPDDVVPMVVSDEIAD